MKLHCFVCASSLFPDDVAKDQEFHVGYLNENVKSTPLGSVLLTVIQNGCIFPIEKGDFIRNPMVKSLAYNWLLCDANCRGDYWLFLPEDCQVSSYGWEEIERHINNGKKCFALSRDPKALVGKRGIFQSISESVKTLCDMNFLGKEIGCVILRGELDKLGFHCITKEWKKYGSNPDLWGNAIYQEMNMPGHPDINHSLKLPIFQDYGFDGWKASKEEIEGTFMKIVSKSLDLQRVHANDIKNIISYYGPRISNVPYKGFFSTMVKRLIEGFRNVCCAQVVELCLGY